MKPNRHYGVENYKSRHEKGHQKESAVDLSRNKKSISKIKCRALKLHTVGAERKQNEEKQNPRELYDIIKHTKIHCYLEFINFLL